MTWVESIRVAGWSGKKLDGAGVEIARDCVRRGIRGRRRLGAAEARIERWVSDAVRRRLLTFAELVLLLELDPIDEAEPWCFVDLELGPDGRITELGVALLHRSIELVAEGSAGDLESFQAVVADRWLVAHNGDDHDFPILLDAGAALPSTRIDSMRTAWVAWPAALSHSLGALTERNTQSRIDPAIVHHAGADAQLLLEVWCVVLEQLRRLPPPVRSELARSLAGVVPDPIRDALFGSPTEDWAPPPDVWRPDMGVAPTRSAVRHAVLDADTHFGSSVLVVERLREAMAERPEVGIVAIPEHLLDDRLVVQAPAGWARAVAVQLVDSGAGLIDLAPIPLRAALASWSRGGDTVMSIPGVGLITDRRTVVSARIERPLVLADGLGCLFDPVDTGIGVDWPDGLLDETQWIDVSNLGRPQRERCGDALAASTARIARLAEAASLAAGGLQRTDSGARWMLPFPDPAEHAHGVTILLSGGVGGDRSAAFWSLLLGPATDVTGPASMSHEWRSLDGLVSAAAKHAGRRAAELLAVAAAQQRQGSVTVVVDNAASTSAVVDAARGVWLDNTGTSLLRPPEWPTIDETRRRMRQPSTVITGHRHARFLVDLASDVMLARSPSPRLEHPTVRRMLDTAGDDPFGSVVEPLVAHMTAEFVALCSGARISVADPMLSTGLLSDLIGWPTPLDVDDVPLDRALRDLLLDQIGKRRIRVSTEQSVIDGAVGRLLGPGMALKDFQRPIVADVVQGHDVLAVFRTGMGKSLCYQVPALVFSAHDATTLVVSPLTALQRDQIAALRRKGVFEAVAYNSSLGAEIRSGIRRGIRAGFYRVVFVAPEALAERAIGVELERVDLALVAVDEAHCISEMGHDFRPDYRTIPRALKRIIASPDDAPLPGPGDRPVILALTGTASPAVQADIQMALS